MTIKVSAICLDDKILALFREAAKDMPEVEFSAHNGTFNILSPVLESERPNMVLIDFPIYGDHEVEKIESALRNSPDTRIVLVSPDRTVEFLIRAMRCGVREILPSPINVETLKQAIKHELERAPSSVKPRGQHGQVLSFLPVKGGAGSTFLATNMAFALSMLGNRVALLDLNLYFGDAAMFLGDSVAKSSILDVALKYQDMDQALIESSMVKVSERLHMLVAPESPQNIHLMTSFSVEKIIELCRSFYDYVVLDLNPNLDPLILKALDMSDRVHLVTQMSLPFLAASKRVVSVLRELGYTAEKMKVVVTRYEKGGDIDLTSVEKATLLTVHKTISNSSAAVVASINQGIPLMELRPKDPVAQELHQWADELSPRKAGHVTSKSHWMDHFKKWAA
jgi:pilus assembly protein CpaE